APVINGVEGEKCEAVSVRENSYIDIELNRPDAVTLPDGSTAEYISGDVSCGDLDGDGEYEVIVKWITGISSSGMYYGGFNGPVLLDAYKLDGTRLWKQPINLGVNVYTDEHNTQFLVYDFDGDGHAEITCQTSAGSMDAFGEYVSTVSADENVQAIDNNTDYRDTDGRTCTAPELFTVFDGKDGSVIDTIYYPINICSSSVWGDDIGNRSTRFLADVSYLDGEKPYAVYWRGYYTQKNDPTIGRTGVFGASFDGERLNVKYVFDTYDVENSIYADGYVGIPAYTAGNEKYIGQGNHNMTTADVDNDGKDEFISGALCFEVNDEDKLMPKWCSFRGHGDALHIGDYDPTHPGFEYFSVHEGGNTTVVLPDGIQKTLDYGMTLYDAATGEELFHVSAGSDTGSGLMLNSGQGGYFQMSVSTGVGTYIGEGNGIYTKADVDADRKFRVFWDGDLYDEAVANTNITAWDGSGYANIFTAEDCVGINPGGHAPVLQADLFGDWREELIYPTEDYSRLRVFSTTIPTNYKIKTLMHDPVYRSGVAAEQTATNLPPHVGFYMGKELFDEEIPEIKITSAPDRTIYAPGEALNTKGLAVMALYENGSMEAISDYEVSGYAPDKIGEQSVTVTYMEKTASFTVYVEEITGIFISRLPDNTVNYSGAPLNTDGLVVSAQYSGGFTEALLPSDYTIEYSPEIGEQTVTVTHMEKTAEFKVTVIEPDIGILNRTYFTDSIESSTVMLPIGSCGGSFTIEHTVRINSMPADCGDGKSDTDGFFVRFMSINSSKTPMKTGGGWYLKKSGETLILNWKGTGTSGYSTIGNLEVGKTYKFKYDFINICTGSNTEESAEEDLASATLTVTDADGQTVGTVSGLPLRNFSEKKGNTLPINAVQIYNRANTNSNASVTFGNAVLYGASGEITSISGNDITANITGLLPGMRLIAAKYNGGVLTDVEIFNPEGADSQTGTDEDITYLKLGEQTITASFAPDKVFLWNGMMSLCGVKTGNAN
ncbi:MAG: bacterial Ig-like domain-containing protein, partial [Hominilimicola sp.]